MGLIMKNYPFFHGASANIFAKARELRKKTTPAEKKLWQHLRKKQLMGLGFRRQHPLDSFILDFYCHEVKLGIELDGAIHENKWQMKYDKGREEEIKALGITFIRFANTEVFEDIKKVLDKIGEAAKSQC